jgi:serine protease Do
METIPVNRVMIVSVTPGSPADRAGLGPGDLILGVNQHPVEAAGDVTAVLSRLKPGDSVSLQVQRGQVTLTTRAKLASQPSNYP